MELGIAGKWALVCGASKGLGFGCAQALVREGVHVLIVARGAEVLEAAANKLIADSARPVSATVQFVAADITTVQGRAAVFALRKEFDIVVTNAGGPPPGDFRDWDRDAWIKAVDANMLAPIFLIKAVVDGMIERKFGRIVNISSINGQKGQFGQTNYSAAKAGDIGFTKALALENAKGGITVNAICPGYINTEMVQAVPKEVLEKSILPLIPVNRLGEPEEIARAVVFLAADEAGAITGSTLSINGGQHMY